MSDTDANINVTTRTLRAKLGQPRRKKEAIWHTATHRRVLRVLLGELTWSSSRRRLCSNVPYP